MSTQNSYLNPRPVAPRPLPHPGQPTYAQPKRPGLGITFGEPYRDIPVLTLVAISLVLLLLGGVAIASHRHALIAWHAFAFGGLLLLAANILDTVLYNAPPVRRRTEQDD